MMNEKNHQNCNYSAEIAGYLYDEIGDREKIVFEKHLAHCGECAAEIAAFGDIRASLADWRETEFAAIATPAINIPYQKDAAEIAAEVTLAEKIRRFFAAANPLAAATAFAVLIVCGGLLFAFIRYSGGEKLAYIEPTAKPVANIGTTRPLEPPPTEANKNLAAAEEKTASAKPLEAAPKRAATEPKPQRLAKIVGETPRAETEVNVRQIRVSEKYTAEKSRRPATINKKAKNIPVLNDYEDEPDDSLRLAELLDDAETR